MMHIDDYTLIKKLGKGAFGEVYLASKQGSSNLYATKQLDKSKYISNPKAKKYIDNEISILKVISHPNLVKFYEIKDTSKYCYIITEFCNGGSLSECLEKYQNQNATAFSEEIVQYLMRQILDAMRYLHKMKILHRDLKLDNILVNYDNENDRLNNNIMKAKIKIIDFGLSRFLNDEELAYSVLGTAINMDPGILHKLNKMENFRDYGYDEKADIWSLGTICYELLIGKSAFNSLTMKELLKKVEKGNYFLPKTLSVETMSFLNCMLQYDPKRRLSAEKLCNHKFLRYDVKDFNKINLKQLKKHDKGKVIQLNSKINESISDIFGIGILESIREENNEDYEDKDERLINKINELSIKEEEKGDNEGMNNYKNKNFNKSKSIGGNLEEKFMKIFKEINADSMRIQQKVIPIIPGLEPDIENIDI